MFFLSKETRYWLLHRQRVGAATRVGQHHMIVWHAAIAMGIHPENNFEIEALHEYHGARLSNITEKKQLSNCTNAAYRRAINGFCLCFFFESLESLKTTSPKNDAENRFMTHAA